MIVSLSFKKWQITLNFIKWMSPVTKAQKQLAGLLLGNPVA